MSIWIERQSQHGSSASRFNATSNPLKLESQYQRDRARIIHSAAFRRLQAKTQVYSVGENDFYRTRLTHSLEVAQIGSGICVSLLEKYADDDMVTWIPGISLIETIGLSHDIGHPPFGHGGEAALNYAMFDHGGFEGNGQTLRILSRLGEYSTSTGMDLTRRSLLGVIKYPNSYSTLKNYPMIPSADKSDALALHSIHPPKCFFDEELDVFDWVCDGFSEADKNRYCSFDKTPLSHYKTRYKSFDTSIMELADDISYAVHDLEDALSMKLISFKNWQDEVENNILHLKENPIVDSLDFYRKKLFSESNRDIKHAISRLVGYFIDQIQVVSDQGFESPLLRYNAIIDEDTKLILDTLKTIVFHRVIKRTSVQRVEFKGQHMILQLFNAFSDAPERLLPTSTWLKYQQSDNPQRIICDYIAGMTDSFAIKTHSQLFSTQGGPDLSF